MIEPLACQYKKLFLIKHFQEKRKAKENKKEHCRSWIFTLSLISLYYHDSKCEHIEKKKMCSWYNKACKPCCCIKLNYTCKFLSAGSKAIKRKKIPVKEDELKKNKV